MSDGSNKTIISSAWQPVPGVSDANIYPYIRKCDTISSNSYLIETPEVVCLIDPGNLPEQTILMAALIEDLLNKCKRPVVVFLTHAHVDHFLAVIQYTPMAAYFKEAVLAVQKTGADALERGDKYLTQADILGLTITPIKTDIKLLCDKKQKRTDITCYEDKGASIKITKIKTDDPKYPLQEEISFGKKNLFSVYHTPGHSPDSICLRIGKLLFIGDVLFAANPGIAGMYGWDQQTLIRSLAGIQNIIKENDIEWVLPGHGRIYPASDAVCALEILEQDAYKLENIAELNSNRAEEIAACADDCMEEINELFTIMSGRLRYVAYMMEELGESGMAEEMTGLIKSDVIDELLEAFSSFSIQHHNSEKVSIHLALKAGQVIGKLERSFSKESLTDIIDPTLVTRAQNLLSDYTTMLRGFCPPDNRSECDLNSILSKIIQDLSCPRCSDDDILSSVDDETSFIRMLTLRLGSQPLLTDIDLFKSFNPSLSPVLINRDIFSDLIIYILEDLVGIDATGITIKTWQNDTEATVAISGKSESFVLSEEALIKKVFLRLAARSGCAVSLKNTDKIRTFAVSFPIQQK
ncbi:MAG: MBL fold metallo-hydrolase [Methanomicrobiaceae archaeon]|nr:MBL fold metallo-hydrolase [Methanomicrobiaceae archaeon]